MGSILAKFAAKRKPAAATLHVGAVEPLRHLHQAASLISISMWVQSIVKISIYPRNMIKSLEET
ncbi:MAG: hypothetical protein EA428_11525 [Spirochaetaceae bacterium]|nr:MAG: hypothetical protein EA428_11525 [Spirochaetaceae bacterium]